MLPLSTHTPRSHRTSANPAARLFRRLLMNVHSCIPQQLKIKHYCLLLILTILLYTLYISSSVDDSGVFDDDGSSSSRWYDSLYTSGKGKTKLDTIGPLNITHIHLEYLKVKQRLLHDIRTYNPSASQNIAFAIPVGGRSERSKTLDRMIKRLLDGGSHASQIYVIEDLESREGNHILSNAIQSIIKRYNVNYIASHIERRKEQDMNDFGIYLARHYHFMLDYLLYQPHQITNRDTAVISDGVPNDDNDDGYNRYNIDNSLIAGESIDDMKRHKYNYAVVIEDDLMLSYDFVKYFYEMSRVMRIDETLYCVSGHNDNAFWGSSFESDLPSLSTMDSLDFYFMRGNHFMAPAFMISAATYNQRIRPQWLGIDRHGNVVYTHNEQLHLRNGHWDRFFDSLTGVQDCIFPSVPRITHQASVDAFTVNAKVQDELYTNLRLSQLKVTVHYGDLSRLTQHGYMYHKTLYVQQSKRIYVLEECKLYKDTHLYYVVDHVKHDRDIQWNTILSGFFGVVGIGGYGGWEEYAKVRGIHDGAVFVQYLSNTLLLIGGYSSLYPLIMHLQQQQIQMQIQSKQIQTGGEKLLSDSTTSDNAVNMVINNIYGLTASYVGCYRDESEDRDFMQWLYWYNENDITPAQCLLACTLHGYTHCGLQNGVECWCGGVDLDSTQMNTSAKPIHENSKLHSSRSVGKHGIVDYSECTETCKDGSGCGGAWRSSIYTASPASLSLAKRSYSKVLPASKFLQPVPGSRTKCIVAEADQSCHDACQKRNDGTQCNEQWFPLVHRSCAVLQSVTDGQCMDCLEEEDVTRGLATPSIDRSSKICYYSRAHYVNCYAKPQRGIQRICVCV